MSEKNRGNLIGRTVLVTGGAVRIGRVISEAFARAGAIVAVHCRNSLEECASLVESLKAEGGEAFWLKADLTDEDERKSLIPRAVQRAGRLDYLINNASVYRRSSMLNLTEERLLSDWRINFMAPFQLMRQFAVEIGEGCIINLLDQRVNRTDPGAGGYGLAKKMLRDAAEAAALEWAPRIRINGVAPGLVLPPPGVAPEKMEPLVRQTPMRRSSSLSEVASACLFLAQSETLTGQVIYVDGGLHLGGPAVAEKGGGGGG